MTQEKQLKEVTIYIDGSSLGNPGYAGTCAILTFGGHEKEVAKGYPHLTNQQAELQAAIDGLSALSQEGLCVTLVGDSQYVGGWINGKYKFKNSTKNKGLLTQLFSLIQKQHDVTFQWVEGHSGHPMNERADTKAREMAEVQKVNGDGMRSKARAFYGSNDQWSVQGGLL